MKHDFDAQRIDTAREAEPDFDAQRTENGPTPRRCGQCGKTLPTGGRGRRRVYCDRSCSSKAHRRTRTERHQDALADALVSARAEIPETADDPGRQELLQLALGAQRLAARFLDALDHAATGTSDDPRATEALRNLEAGLTSVTGRMLRRAHYLRYATLIDRPAILSVEADADTARVETSAGGTGAGDDLAATRVETTKGGTPTSGDLTTTRVETTEDAAGTGRDLTTTRVETTEGPASAGTKPGAPTDEQSWPLVPLNRRPGLGNPRFLRALDEIGEGWHLYHWDTQETLYLVVRDDQPVGWVEYGLWGTRRWIAVLMPDHYLADQDDNPLLHTSPALAARTVVLAARQLAQGQPRG